jgi:hypothetical protein
VSLAKLGTVQIRARSTSAENQTVKLIRSLLDPSFHYVPAVATSVAETWRRFGWRPMAEAERRGQRSPAATLFVDRVVAVKPVAPSVPRALPEHCRAPVPE